MQQWTMEKYYPFLTPLEIMRVAYTIHVYV